MFLDPPGGVNYRGSESNHENTKALGILCDLVVWWLIPLTGKARDDRLGGLSGKALDSLTVSPDTGDVSEKLNSRVTGAWR